MLFLFNETQISGGVFCNLAAKQIRDFQPTKEFLYTDRTNNLLRLTLQPLRRVPPSCCTKIYPSLVPWQTSQTHAKKCIGQKQYLAGEVGEKVFNLTLMNKLIRIEWVSECHKTAYEAHGYDVISMSKNVEHLVKCVTLKKRVTVRKMCHS